MSKEKIWFTIKQVELIKEINFMAYHWAKSLIDSKVKNGKADLTTVRRLDKILKKKLPIKKDHHE